MEDFKNFSVWQRAHELILSVYRNSSAFPKEEMDGLTSQLRRTAASIGANLREGCGRSSDAEMKRFLQIARGSANELEYHRLLAKDLYFIRAADFDDLESS